MAKGKLYLTNRCLAFYCNTMLGRTNVLIPHQQITGIKKARNRVTHRSNVIVVETGRYDSVSHVSHSRIQ